MAGPNQNNSFRIQLSTGALTASNGIIIKPLETREGYRHGVRFANTYVTQAPTLPEPTYPITISNAGIYQADASFATIINTSAIAIGSQVVNSSLITIPLLSIGGSGFGGGLLGGVVNTQIFTSNGTWTKPTGLTGNEQVIFQLWGAGGNAFADTSSWSDPDSPVTVSYSQIEAGGGGAYFSGHRLLSDLSSSIPVTVGQSGGASSAFGGYSVSGGGNASAGSPGGGATGVLSPWGGGTGAEYFEPNNAGAPFTPTVSAGTSSIWGGGGGSCSGTSGGSSILGYNIATGGSATTNFGNPAFVSASVGFRGEVRVWVIR